MAKDRSSNGVSRRMFIAGAAAISSQLISPAHSITAQTLNKPVKTNRLDIDKFVADCIEAGKETEPQSAIKEVLAEAVSTPRAVLKALGEPKKAGINVLHRSKSLTIFNANWTPQMNLMPHNHLMWAMIGIFTGREDNILWRKNEEGIKAFGAEALFKGDVGVLPVDAIHSVTNPLLRFTGGIHIYGGDFFATTRSQWNPETLDEEPSDGAAIRKMFERENERMRRKGNY